MSAAGRAVNTLRRPRTQLCAVVRPMAASFGQSQKFGQFASMTCGIMTANLLMMSGANPAAVQRIMRHKDPRLTTEVYGRLAPEYLRAEVDRLNFGFETPK